MAKKLKKDQRGQGAQYSTRARALRKLQLSLADFRRLCILKGIYPRDPKKKRYGKDQVYYHKKDLLHLAADRPLLSCLWEIKATNKKIRKHIGRKEHKDAKRRLRAKPRLPLQHIIRQKFPSLVDAIEDLDDCLCTTFLIAGLPSNKARGLPPERSLQSVQLSDQFLLLVSHIRALRKAFMSIKGFFFQAEILGRQVTWLIPHAFAQTVPDEVDCRILETFSLLYSSSLRLILFKLYKLEGLLYPPVVPKKALPAAAASPHLLCHKMQQAVSSFHLLKATKAPAAATVLAAPAPAASPKTMKQKDNSREKLEDATSAGGSSTEGETDTDGQEETQGATEAGLCEGDEDEGAEETPKKRNAPAKKQSTVPEEGDAEEDEEPEAEEDEETDGEGKEDEGDEDTERVESEEDGKSEAEDEEEAGEAAEALADQELQSVKGCGVVEHSVQYLFDGLFFFLCRETPLLPLSFVIRSCGGRLGWQASDSPVEITDSSITHQVVDRPAEAVFRGGEGSEQREYVQPQWVFDCLNAGILLPTEDYGPGKTLPPHLSPFVDDEAEGYIPHQREVVAKLQKSHKEAQGEKAEGEESDQDGHIEDPEALWRREREADVEAEAKGSSRSSSSAAAETVLPRKSSKTEAAEERFKHQKALINKKHKRLLDRIEFGKQRKEQQAAALRAKRRALEQKQQE